MYNHACIHLLDKLTKIVYNIIYGGVELNAPVNDAFAEAFFF